jgi:hypothetical protein
MRNEIRDEDVNAMDKHLANNLFRHVEEPVGGVKQT